MKIMVISGSPREISRTRHLVQRIEEELRKRGVQVLMFDVGLQKLPLYTGSEADGQHPEVQSLRAMAEEASGFFICSPEYHSSISGALKNALDFLSYQQFKGKPSTIAAIAGGGKGGINALNNLRTILRALYSLVLPQQHVVDPVAFDEQLNVVGEECITKLNEQITELLKFTHLITAKS
jgi:azobenzene reductase